MITQEVVHDVAEAQVSDDCAVELWVADLRKHRSATLSPAQARELAAELVRAADEAERGAGELVHEYELMGFEKAGEPR